uniref:Uncharacterized protein n=2 Tax=Zea mays TaxID=4577 RepID=A0A804M2N7_MAIZE
MYSCWLKLVDDRDKCHPPLAPPKPRRVWATAVAAPQGGHAGGVPQSVSKERQDFLGLVNKEIELYNSMLEKEGAEGEEEAKRAYIAAREESGRRLLQKKTSHQYLLKSAAKDTSILTLSGEDLAIDRLHIGAAFMTVGEWDRTGRNALNRGAQPEELDNRELSRGTTPSWVQAEARFGEVTTWASLVGAGREEWRSREREQRGERNAMGTSAAGNNADRGGARPDAMGRAESSERSWDDAQRRSRLRAAAKTSAEETPTGRRKEEAAGAKLHGQELGANSSRRKGAGTA